MVFLILVPIVGAFGGVCMPIIRARMSQYVVDHEQGNNIIIIFILYFLFALVNYRFFHEFNTRNITNLEFNSDVSIHCLCWNNDDTLPRKSLFA